MMLRQRGGKLAALACAMGLFVLGSIGSIPSLPKRKCRAPGGRSRTRGADRGAIRRLCGAAQGHALAWSGRHADHRDRTGLPGGAGVPARLAHGEGQLEGHARRISRPRIHARRLPDRDSEERQDRPHRGKLRGAGGFRLPARHRDAAGRPSAHPDGVQPRHDREDRRRAERSGRHPDRDRGAGHRLARARRQLGAALRQQVHRLHVGGDDARHRALHDPRHRTRRACTSSRCMHSDFGSPYRNTQQSPVPDRPHFKLDFTITPGAPVLPPPPERQAQTNVRWLAAAGRAGRDAGVLAASAQPVVVQRLGL